MKELLSATQKDRPMFRSLRSVREQWILFETNQQLLLVAALDTAIQALHADQNVFRETLHRVLAASRLEK